ncbi:MAG: COX15/CtaA family protein [Bacteroidia bacterium]|nr:COX15/CtaA family protein [Bacteroidia bacterium]
MDKKNLSTAPIVRRYRNIAGITVGAVIVLIFVGGLVRMTGSGMGCPDWPQCFGQWVPPTDISQLPADYKQQFAVQGREIADFDPVKTWIEYINRLVGVLIGFFALLTLLFSIPMRKIHPRFLWTSLIAFLSVGFQGWLGSIVVKTDLSEGMITLHMIVAMVILGMYLWGWLSSYDFEIQNKEESSKLTGWLIAGVLVLVVAQIILGTQVREGIDVLAKEMGEAERANWIDNLGVVYNIHSFYYFLLLAVIGLWVHLRRYSSSRLFTGLKNSMLILLSLEILLGIGMHRLDIPKVFQPLHLLLATLIFASLFAQLVVFLKAKTNKTEEMASV